MRTIKVFSLEAFQEHCREEHGICLQCFEAHYEPIEPDAESYKCHECGAMAVMGFEMAMVAGYVDVADEERG